MNVSSGQQQPRACGKARHSSVVPAQDDVRAERVVRETDHRSDLCARESPERVTEREVMRRDVDW